MELRKLAGKVRLYENCVEPADALWRSYEKILFKLDNGAEIQLEDMLVPADITLATYRPVVFYLFRPDNRASYFLYAAKTQAGKQLGLDGLRHYLREGPFTIPMDHHAKIMEEATSLLNKDGMTNEASTATPLPMETTEAVVTAPVPGRLPHQGHARPGGAKATIINI